MQLQFQIQDSTSKPSVAGHDTPPSFLGHFYSLNTLSYGPNLIHLYPKHINKPVHNGHQTSSNDLLNSEIHNVPLEEEHCNFSH